MIMLLALLAAASIMRVSTMPHASELLIIIITKMRSANLRVCDTCCEDFCYGRCEAFQYQDSQVPHIIVTMIMSDEQTR